MSKRIDTDGGNSLRVNPFGGLPTSGLPKSDPAKAAKAASSVSGPAPGKTGKRAKRGRVELRREKSGRGGKTVTTLSAFASTIPLGELEMLAFDLKKACACGGTLKGRHIELQGDVRDRVLSELESRGYQPVRAGG